MAATNNKIKCVYSDIKEFTRIFSTISTIPGVTHVYIQFSTKGMTTYARPQDSPIIFTSFLNASKFKVYECKEETRQYFCKSRFDEIRKKINKQMNELIITDMVSGQSGLVFGGCIDYCSTGNCQFNINIYEVICDIEPLHLDITYDWHIVTPTEKIKDNYEFISDKCDYLSFETQANTMKVSGINNSGLVNESIQHTISSTSHTDIRFVFFKKYLKFLSLATQTQRLMKISFNDNGNNKVHPVMFTYDLDHSPLKSHISLYVLPCTE